MTEPDDDADPQDAEPGEVASDDLDGGSKRRALVTLLALAAAAGLLSGLMAVFLGGSGGHHRVAPVAGETARVPSDGQAPSGTAAALTHSPRGSATATPATPTAATSTTGRPSAVTSANPCPSATPCAVAGDGGVVAAVNAFRAQHGLPAVPGSATAQAQQCALSSGDGPACAPHYAWEPVPARDAGKVISLVTGRGDGVSWLLDPQITSLSVGWAYSPATDQYACAILKTG